MISAFIKVMHRSTGGARKCGITWPERREGKREEPALRAGDLDNTPGLHTGGSSLSRYQNGARNRLHEEDNRSGALISGPKNCLPRGFYSAGEVISGKLR